MGAEPWLNCKVLGQDFSPPPRPSLFFSSLACQNFNRLHCISRKRQGGASQVLLHVLGIGSSGQRQHSHGTRECENNLGWSEVLSRRKSSDDRMAQHLHIGGEKRKSLIDDVAFAAE